MTTKTPKKRTTKHKKQTQKTDKKEHEKAVEVVREVIVREPEKSEVQELKLDRNKIELLKRTIARGATDDELLMFINVCKGLDLSPFLRHVHLVKRWDSKLGQEVAAVQVGIDGFRSIAEGTQAYAGSDDIVYGPEQEVGKIKVPSQATSTVYKIVDGQRYPFVATARWDEFYPGEKQGFMWRAKPYHMLGKCAEAQALRKAFPKVLGGVYTPEEMEQGAQKSPEQIADTKMQKALAAIQKDTDIDRMFDYLEKVDKSATYTDEQKQELRAAVEARAKELDKQTQ